MPVQVCRHAVPGPALLDGRLKIRHLVHLDAIGSAGSIVRAAERLHVTQPVVTRALHEVEGILGVRLYDRGPRGLTSTPSGAAFLDHYLASPLAAYVTGADLEVHGGGELPGFHVATHTNRRGDSSRLP